MVIAIGACHFPPSANVSQMLLISLQLLLKLYGMGLEFFKKKMEVSLIRTRSLLHRT